MFVVKRSNEREEVSFDKVLKRIKVLSDGLNVNFFEVAQKVCTRIYDGVKTSELDELAAQMCSSMILDHPDYSTLASRIIVSNHHKNTSPSFSETIQILYDNKDAQGEPNPLVSDDLYEVVRANKEKLNSYLIYSRDFDFDYFGFKTLEKAYLMRVGGKVVERPQHMFMRVAIGIHGADIKDALHTYDKMSTKHFVHATPTLFNSGTRVPQMSSCYLYSMDDSIDGIFKCLKDCAHISKYAGGIGLHIHNVRSRNSTIRGTNGTSTGIVPMLRVYNNTARYVNQSGRRNGSIAIYMEPWHGDIEHFIEMRKSHGNEEERARDLFYALWIPDLFMKRVQDGGMWSLMCPDACKGLSDCYGEEFEKLYTGYEAKGQYIKQVSAQDLWFRILQSQIETGTPYMLYKDHVNRKNMQSNIGIVKSSNLCVAPETMILTDKGHIKIGELVDQRVNVWNGMEFSETVVKKTGEAQKLVRVTFDEGTNICCTPFHKFYTLDSGGNVVIVEAKDLVECMTIAPYRLPDDAVDRMVRVRSVSDGGISDTYCFNEPKRHMGVFNGIVTGQCSEIVEVSDDKTCAVCNLASMCLPTYVDGETGQFDYARLHDAVKIVVKNLNKVIDRNFYPIAEAKSSNMRDRPIGIGVQGLADVFAILKVPYESEEAKALNKQIFETMYHAALEESMELAKKLAPYETFPGSPASRGILQFDLWEGVVPSARYNWDELREKIKEHGLRNSLLLAPMPTASTSQIMGFTESFEPITSNIYKRKTLAGEFILVNKYLVKDLSAIGLWTTDVKNHIVVNEGSIQNISQIPQEIRDRYKTVWECKMRSIIDMAADRGAFIDQSQSMNLYVENPDFKKLTAMHFHGWSKGLKTGMYYLRSKAKSSAQKFTVDPRLEKLLKEKGSAGGDGSTSSASSCSGITAGIIEVDNGAVCETCSA